ncbi:unnamed protein product [Dovyalis caffra]|uniref:Gnk2-homologous domain-containing protein n=1 Tax=Dovyalis caffra TaxID=77055 RepID=A0AAV1SH97_9ROSI|nr:unnamed protein product [Dovyalis caffra]
MFNLKAITFVALSTLWLLSSPCHADNDMNLGSQCSLADNSTADSEYQTNLFNLLNSLAANAPIQNGFYTTTVGKGANKIYGLTQCRGDISSADCAACIKNAAMVRVCSEGKNFTIWFRWCLLRYSNLNFFGERKQSGMATGFDADLEDPNLVSEALNFTNALASSTPNQPLMFQTAVLDVGQSGKRYGLAQCTRDLSKSACRQCLNIQLNIFKNATGNRRGWEIYASSCSMLYHDYQFYFRASTPSNEGESCELLVPQDTHHIAWQLAWRF